MHPVISNMQPKDRGKRRLGQWHYFAELVFIAGYATRTLILFQVVVFELPVSESHESVCLNAGSQALLKTLRSETLGGTWKSAF